MKRNTIFAIAVLVLTAVVQFLPFISTSSLKSNVEDGSKTWAELPAGFAGKAKSEWPTELRFNEYENWTDETKGKYHLVGEHNISIFNYVWTPAGALENKAVLCYIFVQVMFVITGVVTFVAKTSLSKAFVALLLALSAVYATVMTFLLPGSYVIAGIGLILVALAAFALTGLEAVDYMKAKAAGK